MNQSEDLNPWNWLLPHDTARFGERIHDPKERASWCSAILTGGLPLLWRKYAEPVRDLIFSKMELKRGDRVFVIGESLESCGFIEDIRARIGEEGEIREVEVIEEARDKVLGGERGRGGQLGTWPYRYTKSDPDNHYDAIAVLQGVQHTDDWRETAIEFHRVVKPGGMIVLAELTFGPNLKRAAKLDLHLEYYLEKLCRGAGMSGIDLAYYSPQELQEAFKGLLRDTSTFEWRGLECFWGRK